MGAKDDLTKKQERREKELEKEKQRQATRLWWKNPSSSSTLAWVHSGGARGTSQGEVRQRWSRAEESMVVNPNNTTIHLDTTQEETEVLDLDQTLTEEGDMATETGERHTTTKTKDNKGEKVNKGKGRKD